MSESGRLLLVGVAAVMRDAFAADVPRDVMVNAADGAAALEFLRARVLTPPRLIVVALDGGAAVDFVTVVKKEARMQMVPLLVLYDAADARHIDACYCAGANACAMQPAAPAALRDLAAAIAGYWLGTNEVPPAGG